MSSPPEKNSDKKVCKGRRTQRRVIRRVVPWPLPVLQPVPQPVPAPQSMPLPPPVIKTNSSSTTISDEFSGLTTEDIKVAVANTLVFMSKGGHFINRTAAGQSSGTPTSQSQPPSNDTAQRTGHVYTCNICSKKFNSPQALGGHSANCRKRKRESDARKVQSSTDTATTSSSIVPNLDDVTNIKIATQANSPVVRPPVLAADDGLNGTAPQQIAGEQQPDGGLDRNEIVQQQRNGGFLDFDLNLPPLPDQDDTMEQPLAVQPHDADRDPTI